jgi:hypothetical protein
VTVPLAISFTNLYEVLVLAWGLTAPFAMMEGTVFESTTLG